MGEKIFAKTTDLRPTQNYLEQSTIDFYQKKGIDVPIPVGEDFVHGPVNNTKYFILDGHHNSVYRHLKQEDVILWVAKSPKDLIPYELFPTVDKTYIDSCNEQIKARFNEAQFLVASTRDGEIFSIDDLIESTGIKFSRN